ncbi:MAG: cold shock domain-containing protein [Bacillota bacterium]|nr:cold shock domain-containing protein [Bacillota bacterium]
MMQGTVKWFNADEGFGFIEVENNDDIFVHASGIKGEGNTSLHAGQRVEFNVFYANPGLQAEDVVTL